MAFPETLSRDGAINGKKMAKPDQIDYVTESRGRKTSMTIESKNKLEQLIDIKYLSKNKRLIDETICIEALAQENNDKESHYLLRSTNRTLPFKASKKW